MRTGDYSWLLTVKVGIPVVILALIGLVFALGWAIRSIRDDRSFEGFDWIVAVLSALGLLGVAAILGIGYVPWAQPFHEYHALNEVEGTVDTATSRLISDGDKGVTQRYVIKFVESDELFACDDSRCTQVVKGKHLRLLCTREWQYQATSGWGCRYGQAS